MADWDKRFIELANLVSSWSKDKTTKVGAIIIDDDNHDIVSVGYNGFPRDSDDSKEDRYQPPQKYFYTEHAERNALYNAARNGKSTNNKIMYVQFFPCVDCARGIIQSGIKKLITPEPDFNNVKWGESVKIAKELLDECGVEIKYITLQK
jgi:dCMP deaminase